MSTEAPAVFAKNASIARGLSLTSISLGGLWGFWLAASWSLPASINPHFGYGYLGLLLISAVLLGAGIAGLVISVRYHDLLDVSLGMVTAAVSHAVAAGTYGYLIALPVAASFVLTFLPSCLTLRRYR